MAITKGEQSMDEFIKYYMTTDNWDAAVKSIGNVELSDDLKVKLLDLKINFALAFDDELKDKFFELVVQPAIEEIAKKIVASGKYVKKEEDDDEFDDIPDSLKKLVDILVDGLMDGIVNR